MPTAITAPTLPAPSPTPVLDALRERHATKLFDAERKVSEADLAAVLEAARLSPTSFGLELFEIVMVQDPAHREALRASAWGANGSFQGTTGQLGTASHFGVITAYTAERARYDSAYLREFLLDTKGFDEAGADGYIGVLDNFMNVEFDLTDDRKLTDWTGKQAYIALANMMTAAASLGIDSCPIEGFDQAIVARAMSEDLGVDMSYQRPAVMFALGYRVGAPGRARTRRRLGEVVTWR